MANNFQILITAKDQASAVVNRVRSVVGSVPGSVGKVSSALDRLGDTQSLDRVSRGVAGLAHSAMDAAQNFGVLNGAMGLAVGAGSVAGMASTISYFGRTAVAAQNAAGNIGIAAGRLRTLQGAAGLAGLSADAMTSSLDGLATTLQDAQFGRNNDAAAMLNMLGIQLRRTKSGAVDTEAAMGDLADAIARQDNPQTQARIAGAFGISALLPMLRKGRAGWNAYIKDIERLNGVSEETQQNSAALGESLNRMRAAADGVGTVIEGRLGGRFTPIINKMTEWTASNKDAAASLAEVGAVSVTAIGAVTAALAGSPIVASIAAVTAALTSAAEAYEHWDSIERRWSESKIRKLAPEERAKEDEGKSWWRRLIPSIHFSGTGWAALDEKPPVAQGAPPVAQPVPPVASGRQPIGIRNNNPLNLRSWGRQPVSGGFARFDTADEGLAAGAKQLLKYQGRGLNTISDILERWAPPSENDTDAYVRDVSRRTGLDSDQPLNLRDTKTLSSLMSAMVQHENGRNPYSPQQVEQAAQQAQQSVNVTITVAGAPEGTTVTASDHAGNPVAARVEYTMPSYAVP